jgi:hypothetical protein
MELAKGQQARARSDLGTMEFLFQPTAKIDRPNPEAVFIHRVRHRTPDTLDNPLFLRENTFITSLKPCCIGGIGVYRLHFLM